MKVSFFNTEHHSLLARKTKRTVTYREPDDEFGNPKIIDPRSLVGMTITDRYYDKRGVLVLELENNK